MDTAWEQIIGRPLAQIDRELIEAGYTRGFPPRRAGQLDGEAIDIEVCTTSQCGYCGRHGLTCRPYFRAHPRSYRAFAHCPRCGLADEF
jgi:hypothetical protein